MQRLINSLVELFKAFEKFYAEHGSPNTCLINEEAATADEDEEDEDYLPENDDDDEEEEEEEEDVEDVEEVRQELYFLQKDNEQAEAEEKKPLQDVHSTPPLARQYKEVRREARVSAARYPDHGCPRIHRGSVRLVVSMRCERKEQSIVWQQRRMPSPTSKLTSSSQKFKLKCK